MRRVNPPDRLSGVPCSIVAVCCALGRDTVPDNDPVIREDGYATLSAANRYIRNNLKIKKRTDCRRGERPKLKDLHLGGRAIVCVYGHYLYLDGETYWSFFENENDDVVAVWMLK